MELFLIITLGISFTAAADFVNPAIYWNISATTRKDSKCLLKNVVGCAGKGKLHAIMGPSGSGKTTLLNVLAGTIPKKSMELKGIRRICPEFESSDLAYVQQENMLFSQLTVLETLETSVALKSSSSSSSNQAQVNQLLSDLGLKTVKFTRVGDAKTRGISGGEQKRLSIANELVNGNLGGRLILLDEPTSGLDSFQAQRVVEILHNLTSTGNTIVLSIHQPRASIVKLFDEISLLSDGNVIYSGPMNNLESYFKSLGYFCPSNINIVEYLLDLISIDYTSAVTEKTCRKRVSELANAYNTYLATKIPQLNQLDTATDDDADIEILRLQHFKSKKPILFAVTTAIKCNFRKFSVLIRRAWRQITRDKAANIARLSSSLFSALLFGAIYFRLGMGASTVADRLGLLQVAAVNTAMTALIKATTAFCLEKLIIQRERRSGAYGITPYFTSKLLAEFPVAAFFPCLTGYFIYKLCGLNDSPGRLRNFLFILTIESLASSALGMFVGSFAPTVEASVAIAPAVMVVFIVFGGLYVVNAPKYLSWLSKLSLIRWTYEALCVNELTGLNFQPERLTGPLAVTSGEQVLESIGYRSSTVYAAVGALFRIILGNYLMTYLMLRIQTPAFESIESNSKELSTSLQSSTSNTTKVEEEKESRISFQVGSSSSSSLWTNSAMKRIGWKGN